MQPSDLKYAAIALETWSCRAVSGYGSLGIAGEFTLVISAKVAFALRMESMRQPGAKPEPMAVDGRKAVGLACAQTGGVAACTVVKIPEGNIQFIVSRQPERLTQTQMRPPVIAAGVVANGSSLISRKIPGTVIRLGSSGAEAALIIHAPVTLPAGEERCPCIITVPFAVHVPIVAVIAALAIFSGQAVNPLAATVFALSGYAQNSAESAAVHVGARLITILAALHSEER